VGQKVTLLVFEFPLLLDALYLQFLFIKVSLSLKDVVLRLEMQTSSVLIEVISCNVVTMVGLTNDERCLIHNSQSACVETLGV